MLNLTCWDKPYFAMICSYVYVREFADLLDSLLYVSDIAL